MTDRISRGQGGIGDYVARNTRALRRHAVAVTGFDPNEDPVIIGGGAYGGGSSTPSDVSTGTSGNVALGSNAAAHGIGSIAVGNGAHSNATFGDGGVAIGDSATAANSAGVAVGSNASASAINAVAIGYVATASTESVAIGDTAVANGHNGVAIGFNAEAAGIDSVAIGHQPQLLGARQVAIGLFAGGGGVCDDGTSVGANAVVDNAATGASSFGANAGARADSATALGYNADTNAHAHSTALGADASCTTANQVMLGTSLDTVMMPGNFDGSALPTTNPGAGSGLVWSNSGVLTVA